MGGSQLVDTDLVLAGRRVGAGGDFGIALGGLGDAVGFELLALGKVVESGLQLIDLAGNAVIGLQLGFVGVFAASEQFILRRPIRLHELIGNGLNIGAAVNHGNTSYTALKAISQRPFLLPLPWWERVGGAPSLRGRERLCRSLNSSVAQAVVSAAIRGRYEITSKRKSPRRARASANVANYRSREATRPVSWLLLPSTEIPDCISICCLVITELSAAKSASMMRPLAASVFWLTEARLLMV